MWWFESAVFREGRLERFLRADIRLFHIFTEHGKKEDLK